MNFPQKNNESHLIPPGRVFEKYLVDVKSDELDLKLQQVLEFGEIVFNFEPLNGRTNFI